MPQQKRTRGRPATRTQDETRSALIAAAKAVFLTDGYGNTTIEAVAQRSGMSTKTIYKVVENKAELFRLVIEDAIRTGIATLIAPRAEDDPRAALFALSRYYAEIVLGSDGVMTARAVMADQAQFPELRESYIRSIARVADAFDDRFHALIGRLTDSHPDLTVDDAVMLRSMINGPQRMAILDREASWSQNDIASWSERCLQLVLTARGRRMAG